MKFLLCLTLVAVIVGVSQGFTGQVLEQLTFEALSATSVHENGKTFYWFADCLQQVASYNSEENTLSEENPTEDTSSWHFHDENFSGSSMRILNKTDQILPLLFNQDDDVADQGQLARTYLGQAIHTLQTFYSHSNWVELGNTIPNFDVGTVVLADPGGGSPCPNSPSVLATSSLTSGYFSFICQLPPDGKCSYGAYPPTASNTPTSCVDGINKDTKGRRNFQAAYDLALNHTTEFVNDLLQSILDHGHDTSSALRVLMQGQANPDINDKNHGCLPYCAVFTIVPGLIILMGIGVFIFSKKGSS